MDKPTLELADVFRCGFTRYCAEHGTLSAEAYKVANAIMSCRTAAMGGHIFQCEECGHATIAYNSCRNRHCPSCQAAARFAWVDSRVKELLPVPYFHVVFTLPAQINPFALRNQRVVYAILFKAAAETLHALAARQKYLGADIGFIAVLHTWGQNLMDHPHLHCVVPAGGLNEGAEQWKTTPKGSFLFPVKVVAKLFRGKFLDLFSKAIENREIGFHGTLQQYQADPKAFRRLIDSLYKTEWVVYAKPPFAGPEAVLKYLGRYTHRIAIANSRITELTHDTVSFTWKDYADNNRRKVMTLAQSEFIRRFLLHVLPTGFVRIRYFGFLGQAVKKEKLRQCRMLLGMQSPEPQEQERTAQNEGEAMSEKQPVRERTWPCPLCKKGRLVVRREIPPSHHRNRELAAVA